MHDNTDGALFSYRGHTLAVDEGHAAVYGLLGLFIGASEEASRTIRREPHYFIGGLVVSWLVGRKLRVPE